MFKQKYNAFTEKICLYDGKPLLRRDLGRSQPFSKQKHTMIKLYQFFAISLIFSFQQTNYAQNKVDSTLLKSALSVSDCVQNIKKYIGKECLLNCTVVSSREVTFDKDKVFYLLEIDDFFPNNKISVIIGEAEADVLGFSRFIYHQKKVLIRGKIEKNKKIRDEFGNPRLVITLKDLNQITMF